jgi:hypothetical protein
MALIIAALDTPRLVEAPQGNADLFAFPAAYGRAAIFNGVKPLKMEEPGDRVFRFRLIFGQDGQ